MRKSLAIVLGCIVCVFIFQAFTTVQAPKWQNLEILPQDISKNDLDSIMDHFTAALGVKCGFCHTRNIETKKMDFAKDDKPEKLIARKMMLMSMDINLNHFQEMEEGVDSNRSAIDFVGHMIKYVTCYTCHKGKERPMNHPPVIVEENP